MRPLVMGILNVTPDSFSDGGRFVRAQEAIDHGLAMVLEGADLVDVGGESTRPGAQPVSVDEELERVVPVVAGLAGHTRVSVDTAKPEVARAAAAAGATVLNDVTASLAPVAADCDLAWIAMHMQGEPRTMQASPTYGDVVGDVAAYLVQRASAAREAGVGEVWIDPGIGFGKTFDHNWTLLAALPELCELGFPVAVGTSRKRFLGALFAGDEGAEPPTDDRLEGSVATALLAADAGASMLRVHDVAATVAALDAGGWAPHEEERRSADVADPEPMEANRCR